ncbi:MAG: hypothetical protein GC157_15235 [Frankiales bacterium]|nr:hypothetical protein [Frankiales bacterium]
MTIDHGGGDGRLELDDLGGIIAGASTLDGETPADVVGDDERATLRERLEALGILPWLRRHRVPLAALAVVVVLAAGSAWVATSRQPAPDDGTVELHVADAPGAAAAGTATEDEHGVLSFPYSVFAPRPGDTVRVLGVTGPGVGATTAAPEGTPVPGQAEIDTVGVVPYCDDPALRTATYADYALHVVRTDGLGRSVDTTVPLPVATAADWAGTIFQHCLQRWFDERIVTTSVRVSTPSRFSLQLDIDVRNGLDTPVALDVYAGGSTLLADQTQVLLDPRAVTLVPLRLTMVDCSRPEFYDGYWYGDAYGRGLQMYGGLLDRPGVGGGQVSLTWSAATQRRIDAAVARMCAGAPHAELQVISAHPAPASPLLHDGPALGVPDYTVLRSELRIRTDADHVTITDPTPRDQLLTGAVATVGTAHAVVHDGTASVPVDWLTSCELQTNPPTLQLLLTRGGRTFPVRAQLGDRVMTNAYHRMCPQLGPGLLASLGWDSGAAPDDGSGSSLVVGGSPTVVTIG